MREVDLDGVYHHLSYQNGCKVERVDQALPDSFQIHYIGQRMYGLHPLCEAQERYGPLVLHPRRVGDRLELFAHDGVYRIPELVLKSMERRQHTVELCAYTLESPIAIAERILQILRYRALVESRNSQRLVGHPSQFGL